MGSGSYSYSDRSIRADSLGYATKSSREIFKQRDINSAMSPYGVLLRESRDSNEHPETMSIVIALDVTGSMGSVPHHLVKEGLPTLMSSIIQKGCPDPQLLFLAVGDHECDNSPLQVGQFESSDELLDKWLTDTYMEGGGGGNSGESYLLAWYFAGYRTSIDCFEKRGKKGFLFTIGDEPTLKTLPKSYIKSIMGEGQYMDYSAVALLDKARESYNVFHIHLKETGQGSRQSTIDGWSQLMGDNLIVIDRHSEVSGVIADTIINNLKSNNIIDTSVPDIKLDTTINDNSNANLTNNEEIMML
jgi:hypothetical protein